MSLAGWVVGTWVGCWLLAVGINKLTAWVLQINIWVDMHDMYVCMYIRACMCKKRASSVCLCVCNILFSYLKNLICK